MKKTFLFLLLSGFIVFSCGKKDEVTTKTDTTKITIPTNTSPDTTKLTDKTKNEPKTVEPTTEQKQLDEKKKEDAKKEEDKKKNEKRKQDSIKNIDKKPLDQGEIIFEPIYTKRCAKCHGSNGKGKLENTPDFTSAKFKSISDSKLFSAIKNGIKAEKEDDDDMPAFGNKLTDDEIHAAVKYVKRF